MKSQLQVIKASGESAAFSEVKLRSSLERSGATEEQIEAVMDKISAKIYDGISTKKIYRLAFSLLKGSSAHLAAKYHLKQAIMELGPSGYPFEKYIAEILRYQGYHTRVGELVQGHCVQHEVDVIAKTGNKQLMIECKYHNQPGIFCDVKVPLYIHSRFKDVETAWMKLPQNENLSYEGWVVTNTRFSTDAIRYGTCAGLKLIGWDYPAKGSLKEQVDTLGLYPLTCLTSLTKIEKQLLLDKKIVLCQELNKNTSPLEQLGIKASRIAVVVKEAQDLCKHLTSNSNLIS
ncbi:MAG: ATPase [Bacteroidetes bacterium]|nr:ATPase [Bacteroidota bacterium]